MIIYKITNKTNGKVYVGQTIGNLEGRWARHCCPSSGCTALHNAIQKYGAANFTVEQIDTACSREELNQKEMYWIAHYECIAPNGYNLSEGGNGCLGYKHTEETRKLLSSIKSNRPGTPHTEEWKRASSQRQLGGKHPHKGYVMRENQKRILSERKRGKPNPAKYKRVVCVDNGIEFESVQAAAEYVGKSKSAIINAIKRDNRCCGMRWAYVNGETINRGLACVP